MANYDCGACEDLRQKDPNLLINGFGDDECESLAKDKGLTGGDTCEDLHDLNDCLVGNMSREVNAYDTCDWKKFMRRFIPNVWTVLKGIICTLCGINCRVNYLANGASFSIGENTDGDAYAVAGKGVSFLQPTSGQTHTSDLSLQYIAGGLLLGNGTYRFHKSDFEDEATVRNFDNGSTQRDSKSRKGNNYWGEDNQRYANGGELICEFRIKKSAYPQIKQFYNGFGQETGGGAYHVQAVRFDGDNPPDGQTARYAYGQHGWCDDDGTPSESGYDSGHVVPAGWWYIQLRMTYCIQMGVTTETARKYSPRYFMGIRMNPANADC